MQLVTYPLPDRSMSADWIDGDRIARVQEHGDTALATVSRSAIAEGSEIIISSATLLAPLHVKWKRHAPCPIFIRSGETAQRANLIAESASL